jgi:hypothetical protein
VEAEQVALMQEQVVSLALLILVVVEAGLVVIRVNLKLVDPADPV